jgi:dTDP-4-amino-4,6-dideoxygalactose transaminase
MVAVLRRGTPGQKEQSFTTAEKQCTPPSNTERGAPGQIVEAAREGAMYKVGEEEIAAIADLIRNGTLFRYTEKSECARFEARYADALGVAHFDLAASGTLALSAALIGLGIGPGDEVLIPAHTYMATATSVLAVGAIPVLVEVDDSLTIDPNALEKAIGPDTRAVIPVHMWGTACAMDAVMDIATRRGLKVVEDACQGVGGGYEGRMMGSIGDAGAFSFNYFKNMTCGEGGGVATNDERVAERARCAIDPCHFYWQGQEDGLKPFAGAGARASELMGAMLNVQLDRIGGIINAMRENRRRLLDETRGLSNLGVQQSPMNSPEHDCAAQLIFTLPQPEAASQFASATGGVVAGQTGRHTFTNWDQVLTQEGAHHPAMNPYAMPENANLRRDIPPSFGKRSLDILNRTVMIPMDPDHGEAELETLAHNIRVAALELDGQVPAKGMTYREMKGPDLQKFDATAEG